MDKEYLGGEVKVQVIGDPLRHGGGADIKAVRQRNIDHLLARLGHAGADKRVVLLEVGTGKLTVDKGHAAGHHIRWGDQALTRFFMC